MSKIEWTEDTWIPLGGCDPVSPGCAHCYAAPMSRRLAAMGHSQYEGVVDQHGRWTGQINIADDAAFFKPLHRKKPTTYFVSSMSDIFHEGVSDGTLDRIYAVMALCPQHRFLVLTKRDKRMQEYLMHSKRQGRVGLNARGIDIKAGDILEVTPWPLPNVAQGVSVENQAAVSRAHTLATTPAAMRFLSCEPLLGLVDLAPLFGLKPGREWADCLCDEIDPSDKPCMVCVCKRAANPIDWVICGGESGPGACPMHPDWARGLRDQCVAAAVPFFFKQWGEYIPEAQAQSGEISLRFLVSTDGMRHPRTAAVPPGAQCEPMMRVGKAAAGRVLDGRTWGDLPVEFTAPREVQP